MGYCTYMYMIGWDWLSVSVAGACLSQPVGQQDSHNHVRYHRCLLIQVSQLLHTLMEVKHKSIMPSQYHISGQQNRQIE